MNEKKQNLVTFTANEAICKFLADKKEMGYNLSAFLRKIIEEYMKKEESKH